MKTRLACSIALGLVVSLPPLAATREGLPSPKGFHEVKTDNFTLYSNAPEGRTRKIAIQLERFRQALGRITRGFELSSEIPTVTFVFKNDASYAPYKRTADGGTMNVSGYFQPGPFCNSITLDSSAGSRPMRIVYHEFFHAVMNNTMGSLPVWLNEGLAEYFSTFKDRGGSATVEVGHPIEDHLLYLGRYGLLDWEEFFSTTTESPTYNEGTRQGSFYAQAWLLTHYLNADDGRTKQLGKYLGLLRAGEDENEAFVAAFGKQKAVIGQEVERYRETGSGYVWWDFGEEHGDVEVALRSLEPAEVYFRLGELLARSGQRAAAAHHLEAARSADWPAAPVDRALGLAALHAEDEVAAEGLLRKAVEEGDDSAEAPVLLGELLLGRFLGSPAANQYGKQTPGPVLEARKLFERGLSHQPNHSVTLLALSRTYLFGSEDSTPGVQAIERAKAIRPLDPEVLRIQAGLLARNGSVEDAFRIVEREIRPKDQTVATETARLIVGAVSLAARERLEADDRDGAAAVLQAAIANLRDPELSGQLGQLHRAISSGRDIHFGAQDEAAAGDPTGEAAPIAQAIDEYNEAVGLARAGKQEEAFEKLEKIAADCVVAEVCESAKRSVEQLRPIIDHNRFTSKYNSAIGHINGGDRKAAVETLRELEQATEDPERLQAVQELLRQLGARVTKKKTG